MCKLWFWSKPPKAKGEEDDEEERFNHLLIPHVNRHERKDDLDLLAKIQTIAMSLIGWMRTRRRRLVFLALCSPFLLFFVFALFPVLFAARVFFRLCRRRRREETEELLIWSEGVDLGGGNDELRCDEEEEEDGCDGSRGEMRFLLQRYLEDQLTLVLGFVYSYGEELHEDIRASFDESLPLGNFVCVNIESST
ncbi:uncharacterized protein LOC124927932 [Impatiens glandulifera]|uniref:uncharacterized protein LOC124927932 n=1 Tax=Impatiens glandulifera TaxID=253017 RepID=UPI001FB16567|nr:uncharacterized protein LOC124927932 [Impatiens glandulifera]